MGKWYRLLAFLVLTSCAQFAPPTVTKAEYNSLQTGMTYSQAASVIGAQGNEISRNEIAGIKTVMYQWQNGDGSNMNAMFQNDALVSKAQFGLK